MQAEVSDVAKTEGKRTAKEIKEDLIEEIQQRLQKAPAESKPGYTVTIEIPGDGVFTVNNSIEALSTLLERARKLKTDVKPPAITKKQIKASENALRRTWTPRPEPEAQSKSEPAKPEIQGMGGAVPGEFDRTPQTATGIKNATVDRERATRGLPPAMEPARRSFETVWDDAMAIVDRAPEAQDALIKELSEKPRALTDTEDALLLHRQIDLQNEFGKATRDLAQAYEDRRLADVEDQRSRVDYLSDELLKLYNVNKTAGTETGRGLAARKMMAYEDFSLAAMETQKRAAKGGEPLTEAERTQIETLNKKIEETQKAYDEQVAKLQQRISEFETQRLLDEAKAAPPAYEPKVLELAERFATYMDNQAASALVRLKAKWEKSKRIGIVPEPLDPTMLADASIIGAAKITRGVVDTAKWTASMLKDIGDWIEPYLPSILEESKKRYDSSRKTYFDKLGGVEKSMVEKARQASDVSAKTDKRTKATEQITAKVAAGKTPEITVLVQKLARAIVEENPKITRDGLIDEVHSVLKEIVPGMTRRQAMDAISGYGDFKQLSKDEVSRNLRDLKGQMQQVAKIQDIEGRQPPLKTGIERREASTEERRLIKLVNEAKRRYGIVVTDPATQLKSALDARKTYYRNQITDLDAQIQAKQKFVKTNTPSPTDAELEGLKKRRDELKADFDAIFGKPELTDAQRVEMATKALERSIVEYERRIKDKDLFPGKPPSKTPSTAGLEALRARRDALKAELKLLQDAAKPKKSPEDIALQAFMSRTARSIADYSERLANEDFTPKDTQEVRRVGIPGSNQNQSRERTAEGTVPQRSVAG